MLNIRKFQRGYELFTTLCIVGALDLGAIYKDSSRSFGKVLANPVTMNLLSLL